MARIRVVSPESTGGDACNSFGTYIYVEGVEVKGVTAATLTWAVGEPIMLELACYGVPDELEAHAHVSIYAECPECADVCRHVPIGDDAT